MPINILFLGRKMVASGGVENYMYNLFSSMDKEEFKIDFLIPYQKREGQAYLDQIEEQGGKIYLIPNQKKNLLQHIISVYKVSKKYKKGIVHIHASDGFHAIDGIIARAAGVKGVIYHSHNASFKKSLGKKISRFLFRISGTYFLGCSREAGEYLFGKKIVNSNKFSVAKNAVNVELFKFNAQKRYSIRKEFNISKKNKVLGFVGRFSPEKNVDFIIEVFSEILKTEPETKLMLVGDGEERENIENIIRRNNIEDQVIFTGVRDDIDFIMSGLDILLLPSDFESLGIVLIEGQTSGLQCIASSNVSSESKVSDRIIYLVLNRDEWVNKIKILNINTDRESSYKDAVKNGYDSQDSAMKMKELYIDILNNEV